MPSRLERHEFMPDARVESGMPITPMLATASCVERDLLSL